jgi:hypothetical protein
MGVVQKAHRIAFLVSDANLDFVLGKHFIYSQLTELIIRNIVTYCAIKAVEPFSLRVTLMSYEGSADVGSSTMRGRNYPAIRVGKLLEVVRRFESSRVKIVAISISDAAECAFARFVFSLPEQGREILERAGLAIVESDLIGLELPDTPQPLLEICTALLQAEVNIIQAYPLLVPPRGHAAVALMVDNLEMGQETLAAKGFRMLTENDLMEEET